MKVKDLLRELSLSEPDKEVYAFIRINGEWQGFELKISDYDVCGNIYLEIKPQD